MSRPDLSRESPERRRPTWVRPGLVMCEICFDTVDEEYADDQWLYSPNQRIWACPKCEHAGHTDGWTG